MRWQCAVSSLLRRVARLEQCIAVQHATPCTVTHVAASPEEQEEVLAILLEAGVLRFGEDGTLLRLGDGGYEPCLAPWRI